jgi:hypothetical protein
VIPGVSGQLLSHAFLNRELLPTLLNSPDLAGADELTRSLDRWWRHVTQKLGPASASRAVLDVAVTPLLALLGHAVPVMQVEDWGHIGAIALNTKASVLVVSVPWTTTIDQAWHRAGRTGFGEHSRWSVVSNGRSLRIVDCARPWARLAIEFEFAALLKDPRGAVVLAALASPRALSDAHYAGSLAAIVDRSTAYSSDVCRALGQGVLNALEGLVVAFGAPLRASKSPDGSVIFDQALTLVYRVLFLLFAEARGLVPVWHETYRDSYTIDALCRRIGERPHAPGLWAALQAISRMAHVGCQAGDLEVTAFNGRLFSPAHTPLVDQRDVPDAVARQVVLSLATAQRGSSRSRVAYHDLGVEQLGSVYERVLEYEVARSDSTVALRRTSVERKTSGSFYTPRSITEFLVRRTLQPLVDGRSADQILSLRIVDPAMGSGAFLVAACHFLADQCERALIRDGRWRSDDVSAAEKATLRRTIAERCLYGVDRNPTAVQVARLSLWLTTLAKDRPLTFLDHHLAVGDSLLGARLTDLGRPVLRRRVRTPTSASPLLPIFDDDVAGVLAERVLSERIRLALDPSNSPADVRQKERRLAALKAADGPFSKWSRAIDVWCALHLWPGIGPPSAALGGELIAARLGAPPTLPKSQLERWLSEASLIARERQAFHWEMEFPEIFFDQEGRLSADGGFDAVIGNPPWDVLRADSGSAALRASDRSRTSALLRFFRESNIYRYQGHGHPNSYQLFVERSLQLARVGGRFGLIVPSGLATDQGSSALRRRLLERATIDTWLGFANRAAIFPIHRSVRFLLIAGSNDGSTDRLTFCCGLSDAAALERRPSSSREDRDGGAISIARSRLEEWDPEHLTIPEITSPQMLRIVSQLSAVAPRLGSAQESGGWGARFGRELNATDDRQHFLSHLPAPCRPPTLAKHRRASSGEVSPERPSAAEAETSRHLPILEGKHLSPFQTATSSIEQVIPLDVAARLIDPSSSFGRTRLAYRDVASATNRLTLIAALLPRHTISTHTVFCLKTALSTRDQWCLLALLNSLVANYLIRTRVTTHVTATVMSRLPVPRPHPDSAPHRELVALARSLAKTGIDTDPDAYARLNAVVASLYQLSTEDYESIVETFPLLPSNLRSRCVQTYVQATETQRHRENLWKRETP